LDLNGATALVTGGTGGLGRRICWAFARAGSSVSIVYQHSKDAAEALAAELSALGPRCVAVAADVTTAEGVDAMIGQTMASLGRIDVLVNNAAYNRAIAFDDLETLDPEVFRYIIEYNLTAPFVAMRAVAPIMKRQGGGRIVNIASVAGLAPQGSSIAYAVSKSGLIHLTRCMAVALAPDVLVNSVAPGLMEGTRMTANLTPTHVQRALQNAALKRATDKDDVADAVVTFARTNSITGQTLVVDAGRVYH
jgi:NAD(P)-dependent dehydrogenase (short-subunit alcohol dehydrogenase family)